MHAKFLIPVLLLLAAPVAAQEVNRGNVADFWSAVKEGQTGRPSSSSVKADYLMHAPNPACADNKPCTEKAVGFTLPVHATMSQPLVNVGTGAETGALGVLGFFAALGLLYALFLLVRLGKADPADHHHALGD
ncbi:hypothetical protein [Azospirillum sp.]|uniref:hypothetical protein n=1 Tax=Azospirillum sp. TaxID=34012 RepID=UPI003D74054E